MKSNAPFDKDRNDPEVRALAENIGAAILAYEQGMKIHIAKKRFVDKKEQLTAAHLFLARKYLDNHNNFTILKDIIAEKDEDTDIISETIM